MDRTVFHISEFICQLRSNRNPLTAPQIRTFQTRYQSLFDLCQTLDSVYGNYSFVLIAVYIPISLFSAYIAAKDPTIEWSTAAVYGFWWGLITIQLAAIAVPAVLIHEKVL